MNEDESNFAGLAWSDTTDLGGHHRRALTKVDDDVWDLVVHGHPSPGFWQLRVNNLPWASGQVHDGVLRTQMAACVAMWEWSVRERRLARRR